MTCMPFKRLAASLDAPYSAAQFDVTHEPPGVMEQLRFSVPESMQLRPLHLSLSQALLACASAGVIANALPTPITSAPSTSTVRTNFLDCDIRRYLPKM